MRERRACALAALLALSCGAAVDLGGAAPGDGGDEATLHDGGEPDSGSPMDGGVDTSSDAALDTLDARAADAPLDGASALCSNLAPPTAPAPCRACSPDAGNCQANGCFEGYYCDVTIVDCEQLPSKCEAGVPLGDCTGYDPPGAPAPCNACTAGAPNCQANGCYGGFYCELSTNDCQRAPPGCDAGQ
jgi:hypothetical protein